MQIIIRQLKQTAIDIKKQHKYHCIY